ncbi:PIG-L family deacetylase [bacterium]|nr:PIG-L family deacetylase [bacterium]
MTRDMLALCLCLPLSGWALPPVHPDRGEAAFQRAVLRASNDLRLLCFAAHPDDEDGAPLAYYGLTRGVHTFTALANYGEGGQNEIGGQLYGDLAVLRARETRAAAELLGTQEVVCMNLEDFGYSKTLAETLEKWGRERTLEQMIVVIRSLRPDVIITNHQPGQGHGHHQAIAALLLPAVEGAANRQEYPEMKTRGLAAWKVSRVFVRRNLPWSTGQEDYDVKVPVGTWDALRGATYLEIAAAALKEHKSQGRWEMVDDVLPSATYTYFTQIYPPGEQVTNDLFEGLTEGFAPARGHYPLYDASAAITLEAFAPCNAPLSRAAAAMPRSREETGRLLAEAHNFLSGLPALSGLVPLERAQPSEETRLLERAVTRYLHERREDVSAALWECAGLSAMLESDDAALVRRQPFTTRLTVTALGPATLTDVTAAMLLPFQWPSQGLVAGVPEPLAPGESARFSFSNQVFSEAPVSTPLEELRRDLFPPRSPLKATVTARAYGALFSRVVETPARCP